jgi:hypothetical protein
MEPDHDRRDDAAGSEPTLPWLKTAHGMLTVIATLLATIVAWWHIGLPRLLFSSEIMAIHARIDAEAFNRDTGLLVLDQTPGGAPIHSARSGRSRMRTPAGNLKPAKDKSTERIDMGRGPREPLTARRRETTGRWP